MGVPRETTDLIETTAVRFRTGQKSPMLRRAGLQNPTEWRCNSPFFGSVLLRFLPVGTAVDRIGDHEVRVCDWGKNGISLLWISSENYHLKPMQAVAKKRENLSQTPEAEPTARER